MTISELFDKAMNDAAKTREEELERERPAKLDHIPLTLKPTNLEDKTNEMMLRMLWKKRQVQQGGNTRWSKLCRQAGRWIEHGRKGSHKSCAHVRNPRILYMRLNMYSPLSEPGWM